MAGKGAFNRRLTDDRIKVFHKLRTEGRTFREIGERFGCSTTTVAKAIQRYLEVSKD